LAALALEGKQRISTQRLLDDVSTSSQLLYLQTTTA
jgi:hypothetical protein